MLHHIEADPGAGELRPIIEPVAASLETAALASRAPLPIPPRLWALAREVRARAGLAPRADIAVITQCGGSSHECHILGYRSAERGCARYRRSGRRRLYNLVARSGLFRGCLRCSD